jgi:hypothetical protein
MGRSSESGTANPLRMYERERLRNMARKLGLRLLKFDRKQPAARSQSTDERPAHDSKTLNKNPAFGMSERAS